MKLNEFKNLSVDGVQINSLMFNGKQLWKKQDVSTKNLLLKSINDISSWFDAVNPPIEGNLQYVNYSGTVQSPFSTNSELSIKENLVEVNDTKGEISSIEEDAFFYCQNLSSIDCLNVSSIGNDAFYHCQNLSSINCPKVQSIGSEAFESCRNLSLINCPKVQSIGDSTFYYCQNLSSIDCLEVTSIGEDAFCECRNLSLINCPKVQSIGDYAFQSCQNLSTIIISSVTKVPTIDYNVFYNCPKPVSIWVKNEEMSALFCQAENWFNYYNRSPREVDFIPVENSVELHLDGGTCTPLTSYVYGIGAILPTDWTKTGYDFIGWKDNAELTGENITEIAQTEFGDKEFWAKSSLKKLTMTYHTNWEE